HPAQLEAANRIFAPSPAEVDEARAAIDAMDAAIEAGHGAASVGGKMIDAATARGFRHVLERAAACDGTSIAESES
ncbi:MAG: hypothetical protein WBV89_11780, partial [Ilumatobacter sp.]